MVNWDYYILKGKKAQNLILKWNNQLKKRSDIKKEILSEYNAQEFLLNERGKAIGLIYLGKCPENHEQALNKLSHYKDGTNENLYFVLWEGCYVA